MVINTIKTMTNQIKFKINIPTAKDIKKYLDTQTIIDEYINNFALKDKIIKKLKNKLTQKKVDFKMNLHKRVIKDVYFRDYFTYEDKKRFKVTDLKVEKNQLSLWTSCEDKEAIAELTKETEYRLNHINFYALIDLSIKAEIEKNTNLIISMTQEQVCICFS